MERRNFLAGLGGYLPTRKDYLIIGVGRQEQVLLGVA